MKYVLIIWVCSFLQGNACLAPIEYTTTYDSWYECSREAHTQSKKILANMGFKVVNEAKLATKYNCMKVRTY